MTKFGILMIGCAGLAGIPGCMADSPDGTQTTESALETAPDVTPDVKPDGIGAFNTLRLVNTQLCLQPQGGSTAAGATLELNTCTNALIQNWELRPQPSGRISMINAQTGLCIYDAPPLPLVNGARPILVDSCFVSNAPTTFASNTLWKRLSISGAASFETEIQFRDTGFCLDIPNDNPFAGALPWNWSCNSTAAQLFSVE
jgi:hypothetical protein